MRIRIAKRDGFHAGATVIIDADTGEQIDDIVSYRIEATVKDPVVHADLVRWETPKRIDPKTGAGPAQYEDRAEVVEIDTEAETA